MQLEAGFNIDRNNPQNTSESWRPTARDGPFASTKGTESLGCRRLLKNAKGGPKKKRKERKNGRLDRKKEKEKKQ